jgi:hypothetical protein
MWPLLLLGGMSQVHLESGARGPEQVVQAGGSPLSPAPTWCREVFGSTGAGVSVDGAALASWGVGCSFGKPGMAL